jgi:Skp family chaperone for outer membrane proteins
MRAYRKLLAAAVLALGVAAGGFGQQITRIAVMDFNKIIASHAKDGSALRGFELKKSQIQAEIDRRRDDIMRLLQQKVDADRLGDGKASQRLKDEIELKTRQLADYATSKQQELDDEAKALASSDAFAQSLYRQVQSIAEAEGYSLVLNLRSADSVMEAVFWYSPMIDITEKVIQALALPPS